MKNILIPLILLGNLLAGCSTTQEVIKAVPGSPSIQQAQHNSLLGVTVRWGGEVVQVSNFQDHTLVEVISRKLDSSSRPKRSDHSNGRFLARINQFIDPENLKPGREITLRGALVEWQAQLIGNHLYRYPLIATEEYKIWPQRPVYPDYDRYRYYWYDPFWDYPYPPHHRGWIHPDYFDLHYHHW